MRLVPALARHPMLPRVARSRIALLAFLFPIWLAPTIECLPLDRVRDFSEYREVILAAGPDLEFRLLRALLTAVPGTVIVMPEGRFAFSNELVLDVPNVTLMGQGPDATILDFTDQINGAQAIRVTADEFTAADFAIENPKNDGLRVEGTQGIVFDGLRVEWTNGPDPFNGAYGLYPVGCRDLLIQNSEIRGAADAGVYVGQCQNVVVRNNHAWENVIGIEIENTIDAEVYLNRTENNTSGILLIDLPGLPQQGGGGHRVYSNYVVDNNTDNFANPNAVIGDIPRGSGILIVANDDIEVFDNFLKDNGSVMIGIASYLILMRGFNDPNYDPFPEGIYIHDNQFEGGGTNPDPGNLIGLLLGIAFFPDPIAQIGWDGFVTDDPTKVADGELLEGFKICIDEPDATFGNLNGTEPPFPIRDRTSHDCVRPEIAKVELPEQLAIPPFEEPDEERIAELCGAGGDAVNWAALAEVDCPRLSDYRLFPEGDPRENPNAPGLEYELTTSLFTDYSTKDRFIFVPEGETVAYREDRALEFPVGTVITKTFSFDDVFAGTTDIVETRLLIRRPPPVNWVGLPFVWREDGTDADLKIEGDRQPVTVTRTDGTNASFDYFVPNIINCVNCHGGDGSGLGSAPIGPKARLLNRDFDYTAGTENQLAKWKGLGILEASAPDPALAPRTPVWDVPGDSGLADPTEDLERRVRAYFDVNCAHCHNQDGPARFTGYFLDEDTALRDGSGDFTRAYGFCKIPVAAGLGAFGKRHIVVPGDADESIAFLRLDTAAAGVRMPELSKSIVHDEAVALVRTWIDGLTPAGCD